MENKKKESIERTPTTVAPLIDVPVVGGAKKTFYLFQDEVEALKELIVILDFDKYSELIRTMVIVIRDMHNGITRNNYEGIKPHRKDKLTLFLRDLK